MYAYVNKLYTHIHSPSFPATLTRTLPASSRTLPASGVSTALTRTLPATTHTHTHTHTGNTAGIFGLMNVPETQHVRWGGPNSNVRGEMHSWSWSSGGGNATPVSGNGVASGTGTMPGDVSGMRFYMENQAGLSEQEAMQLAYAQSLRYVCVCVCIYDMCVYE
jgi:hypothetical protein